MKKIVTAALIIMLLISMAACGSSETPSAAPETPSAAPEAPEQPKEEKFDINSVPFVGTWTTEDRTVFLRVQEGGSGKVESVATNTMTNTINGVSTTTTTKTLIQMGTFTWAIENDLFMYNGLGAYTVSEANGTYVLTGEKTTYYRVGELDYQISLDTGDENSGADAAEKAEAYTLGDTILAEGLELSFTEAGVASDIRISSNSSGIKITSGPSVEAGKQYVYLKGTLKNVGKQACRAAIAGNIVLDGYEFKLSVDTIATAGSPKSSIDHFETVNILLFTPVADELANSFSEGTILFAFNDNFADVSLDSAQYVFSYTVSR